MKIICTDNFCRETVADRLIVEKIGRFYGEIIVEMFNDRYSSNVSSDYYKLVDDDRKLFEPDY